MDASAPVVWLPGIAERIASFLSPNEVSCLRRVDRATAELFRRHTTLRLSQPVPRWAFNERWSAPGACRALTRAQREQLVRLTAASDVVPNLELALEAAGLPPSEEHLEAAAEAGALTTCAWLAAPGRITDGFVWRRVLKAAASGGQRGACEWCLEQRPGLRTDWYGCRYAATSAARRGHVALMDWILGQAVPERHVEGAEEEDEEFILASLFEWDDLHMHALEGCDLATVQRVSAQEPPASWDEPKEKAALRAALRGPNPDWAAKVEWLLSQGASEGLALGTEHLAFASEARPDAIALERLVWLHDTKGLRLAPGDGWALRFAVRAGNAAALTWMLGQGVLLDQRELHSALLKAARSGHVGVLEALRAAGWSMVQRGVALLKEGAEGGQVDVLEWVWASHPSLAQLLPDLPPSVLKAAAGAGSLACMQWCKDHGAYPDEEAWAAWAKAVESGCEAAVELLAEWDWPRPTGGEPYAKAAQRGEWRMLPLLRRLGLSPGSAGDVRKLLAAAAEAGAPQPTLDWLVGLAAEGSAAAAEEAPPAAGSDEGAAQQQRP